MHISHELIYFFFHPSFFHSFKKYYVYSSLSQHQAPNWLKQAKFGIFIHWGLYAVPSWGSVGRTYAEWYWWQLMQKNSPTYIYHKYTYGERFEYDDFIDLWNTSSFDAYQWLDLIDASRAKYYVFTTKHHDGIALFDTKGIYIYK